MIGIDRPDRAAPHPPTPRRPDQKSLQAEATTCRDPGSVDCPGFFFVAVKAQKDILLICCLRCVAASHTS